MPKVREVLERIGDKPLIEALQARGYDVYGIEGDEYAEINRMKRHLESEGYLVEELGDDVIENGFHLYRMRNTEGFRLWLRNFFWQQLGRIV